MAFRDLLTNYVDAKVVISGIGYDLGASVGKGAKEAPDTIFELSEYLPPFTMDGKDISDVMLYLNNTIYPSSLTEIYYYFQNVFKNNKFNIFIGGDHSISIPLESHFYDKCIEDDKTPVIIHIDAHPDFCHYYDDSYYSHACPNKRAFDLGFKEENITLIGIRGYEKQEVEFFEKHPNIKIYNASYILENGYTKMIEEIINKYSDDKYRIYISYDIDANDPSYVSGTGTPESFGLNPYEIMKMLKLFIQKLNVKAMDIVEISPKLDNVNNTTSWLALKTIYELLYVIKERNK